MANTWKGTETTTEKRNTKPNKHKLKDVQGHGAAQVLRHRRCHQVLQLGSDTPDRQPMAANTSERGLAPL